MLKLVQGQAKALWVPLLMALWELVGRRSNTKRRNAPSSGAPGEGEGENGDTPE
jgi:hypothetical protein